MSQPSNIMLPMQPNQQYMQQPNSMSTEMMQYYQNQFPPLPNMYNHPSNSQQLSLPQMNLNAIPPPLQYRPNQDHSNFTEEIEYNPPSSSSDDENMESDANENTNSYSWQQIRSKRKRENSDTNPIQNSNKNRDNPNTQTKDPKPPPIYVYGVTNYKDMTDSIGEVTPDETYFTSTLPENVVKINARTPEIFRKLINFMREKNIVHHSYQLKQERAYRIVLRGLHHSVPLEEIKAELLKKTTQEYFKHTAQSNKRTPTAIFYRLGTKKQQ
ncbi:unnamed protein product [Psylliodes chrysocephalus]|uniref:Uncharacterized protein n=1 Tax=Psylliodes chrysocephalus TaxID=3402493 RepID=A0A9P0D1Z1_9CUCU|nr:unnamed protein product [Psylliodes chrysocephala]